MLLAEDRPLARTPSPAPLGAMSASLVLVSSDRRPSDEAQQKVDMPKSKVVKIMYPSFCAA